MGDTAAEYGLLAKEVSLALFLEIGFNNARATAADARGISQRDIMCTAACVLMDSNQARNAAAALILAAHCVSGALGRDHDDVDIFRRFDQTEVNVEAVSECKCAARLHIAFQIVFPNRCLMLVRR